MTQFCHGKCSSIEGTLTATISGTNGSPFTYSASASWAQGDTASSMATKLSSAINTAASGVVTAAAHTSGANYIGVTSKQSGSSANYSMSVATADTTPQYFYFLANPSFTAGSEDLSGGTNTEASSYGTIYSYQAGYAPNGNIVWHADSVMGTWNFNYDAVDRLASAQNTANGTSTQYAGMYGCWSYDTYGNRLSEAMSATPCANGPGLASWASYNTANNRMLSSSYAVSGVGLDASGNTLYDGRNRYWYDAEGQLCAVQTLGGGVTQYVYDPEGARIAKGTLSTAPSSYTATCAPPLGSGFTLTNWYLVDLGGQHVTEMTGALGSSTWLHSNISVGGRLTATEDLSGLHYELADPLGSKRLQANISGAVENRWTSLPFGNDLNNPSSYAGPDATEHHFTQKERDAETGNDYFFARYYTSALGRFTTPDWSAKVEPVPYAILADPQSLNLYAYVRNNPLTRIDLDGHCGGPNDPWCSSVKVQAEVKQQPTVQRNTEIKDKDGNVIAHGTGPTGGKLVDTVTVGGKPASGVKVEEQNNLSQTRNGKDIPGQVVPGSAMTNANGQFQDSISMQAPTNGSQQRDDAIVKDFSGNAWKQTDVQTLTLTFPNGQSCSATSTRTMTNFGADPRILSSYSLTTTQPVVTTPNP